MFKNKWISKIHFLHVDFILRVNKHRVIKNLHNLVSCKFEIHHLVAVVRNRAHPGITILVLLSLKPIHESFIFLQSLESIKSICLLTEKSEGLILLELRGTLHDLWNKINYNWNNRYDEYIMIILLCKNSTKIYTNKSFQNR